MNVSLVLVKADGTQREVALRKPVGVIGRQTDCHIRIPSASVSRHHCEISVDDGGVTLRDLGSSNGTFVNKQRIQQGTVNAGDLISLGGFVFVVRIDGKPVAVNAEDAIEDGLVEAGGSASAAESRPTAATVMTPAPKAAAKPPARTPRDPDDSSMADFDFLGDDDDLKTQPKL